MDFNFYERYKDYSTPQLLKILEESGNYQPAVIEAIKTILDERAHSPEETVIYQQEMMAGDDTDKANEVKGKLGSLLKPVLQSRQNIQPNRWLNVLLILLVVRLIWATYGAVKVFFLWRSCEDCVWDIYTTLIMLNPVFLGVMLYLLLKQREWGWILLFGECVFFAVTGLSQVYYYWKSFEQFDASLLNFAPLLVRVLLGIYLWRHDVAGIFNISEKSKKQIALNVAGVTFLLMLAREIESG